MFCPFRHCRSALERVASSGERRSKQQEQRGYARRLRRCGLEVKSRFASLGDRPRLCLANEVSEAVPKLCCGDRDYWTCDSTRLLLPWATDAVYAQQSKWFVWPTVWTLGVKLGPTPHCRVCPCFAEERGNEVLPACLTTSHCLLSGCCRVYCCCCACALLCYNLRLQRSLCVCPESQPPSTAVAVRVPCCATTSFRSGCCVGVPAYYARH